MADEFPKVYFMGSHALVEASGRRNVVLTSGRNGELQTRGPDGLLVPIDPEQGWPAQIVRAVNAFEPMRRVLKRLEWGTRVRGVGLTCPICFCVWHDGHDEWCVMAAALRAADGETAP